jgi:parvulin-like peptidyl-prolyl isomerase
MQKKIVVEREDIFQHARLSGQLVTFIEGIATCKIIAATASALEIAVGPEELQHSADEFRLVNQLHGVEETQMWLQQNHLSLDDFETLIQTNAVAQKLAQHLFADRVEAHFYEHALDYAGVVMYEVILKDEDLGMELYFALKEGEISFYEAARQHIQDPTLRRAGGYRGALSRSSLRPEISAAVFAAKPPQLLKPILTSQGVHLISVEEIIRPELNEELRTQLLGDLFSAWIKEKLQESEICTYFEPAIAKAAS